MKVPRELDELMWEISERGDEPTLEQFRSRYPEFDCELDKRLELVKSLRGSRPRGDVPAFVPRERLRDLGPSRLAVAGVALLVLGSVTFATYATMQFVNSKRAAKAPVDNPQPQIVFNPPQFTEPDFNSKTQQDPNAVAGNGETYVPPVDGVQPFDAFMGKVTIESDNISLEEAINKIGLQAGLDVTIAPGFQDKRIRISFVQQPAIGILYRLGQAFGFTPFKQGTVALLIVPATDANKPNDAGAVGTTVPNVNGAASSDNTNKGNGKI